MLIVLHGDNNFNTRRKLDEITLSYKTKHKSGLNFAVFDSFDFEDFKTAWETISMFDEKKLVILKGVFTEAKQDVNAKVLLEYTQEKKIKDDKSAVLIVMENFPIMTGKNKDLSWLLASPSMVQESKNLEGATLNNWIKKEVEKIGGSIESDAINNLVSFCGNDSWRLFNEINKLVSYKKNITKANIQLMINDSSQINIFSAVEALANKEISQTIESFNKFMKQDDDWARTFGMIVFQFRNLLKVKSMIEDKVPQANMATKAKIHPFVLKKTLIYAKKYSLEELKKTYEKLLKIDLSLKTSQLNFEQALESLLV